jgi:hypothetical protein
MRSDYVNNSSFGLYVRVRDEIAFLLSSHFDTLPKVSGKNCSTRLCGLTGDFQFTHYFSFPRQLFVRVTLEIGLTSVATMSLPAEPDSRVEPSRELTKLHYFVGFF